MRAVVVCQRTVVHDLQQQVEYLGMRFLDLIEQHHGVRILADGLGQQTALIEADVARRRTDQPRHRVAFHVLGHVKTNQLDAHQHRQLPCDFSLANAVGPANRKAPIGFSSSRSPERDILMALPSASIARSWPKIVSFKSRSSVRSASRSEAEHTLRRNTRHLGDDVLDHFHRDTSITTVRLPA